MSHHVSGLGISPGPPRPVTLDRKPALAYEWRGDVG